MRRGSVCCKFEYFFLQVHRWFLSTISSLVGVGVSSESLMLIVAMMISFGMSLVAFGERFEMLFLVCIVLFLCYGVVIICEA